MLINNKKVLDPEELWEDILKKNPNFQNKVVLEPSQIKKLVYYCWVEGCHAGEQFGIAIRNQQAMDRVRGLRAETVED